MFVMITVIFILIVIVMMIVGKMDTIKIMIAVDVSIGAEAIMPSLLCWDNICMRSKACLL